MRLLIRAAAVAAWLLGCMQAARAAPCAGFADVEDTSAFCTSITWMKNRAITLGCVADGSLYCPSDLVRRDQMAAFLWRLGVQNAFLNGGNAFGAQAVVGTTDANRVVIIANGSVVAQYEYGGVSPTIVSGYALNNVTTGAVGSTVAGGGAGGVQLLLPNPAQTAFRSFDCSEPPGQLCLNRVTDAFTTVGGGAGNRAGNGFADTSDSPFASVGGGLGNVASGEASTIGGGMYNAASDFATTIAGGWENTATDNSTISGGWKNVAIGLGSSIGGGHDNTASGSSSTIPGGYDNFAQGVSSFAAGVRARALHDRAFVWNGNPFQDTASLADGDFVVYAPSPGRVRLFAGAYGSGGCEVGTNDVGGNLTCQGVITAASFVPPSDRALKSEVVPVDTTDVLARVVAMPIAEWSYTAAPGVRHMGPMGQDFHAAFGLGATDKGIATVDADGVALAAIQGLNAKLEAKLAAKEAEIASLRGEMAELRRAIAALGAGVAAR